mmetsp:Transcript_99823/g.303051  ORF Transcript_99823/g.303051 Transcript_99823/m.303051 type:complete len:250 (+) Transcript_99823:1234-1983(+)
MAAAWFLALSSSRGFRFQELSSSSERPAFSTMALCASSMRSKFASSSSSSALTPSPQAEMPWPALPWNPWITARSLSPRPSRVFASTTPLFMVISLSTASFCTTLSRSSTSLPRAPSCGRRSSSPLESSSSSGSSRMVTAMSVTDWKIVEAMFRTCISSFSSGRRTMAETEFESTSEKPTMRTMTTTSSSTFIAESTWLGLWKLNLHTRPWVSKTTTLAFRSGGPRSDFQGRRSSTRASRAAGDLASRR